MIKLRPYQKEVIDQVNTAWKDNDRLMLQMPTGTGKTTVFSHIVQEFIDSNAPDHKVLLLVHRKELVEQIVDRLKIFGVKSGYILSGKKYDESQRIFVGTIQTINRRTIKPQIFSLIVIDEAHHVPSESYKKIIEFYENDKLKLLGVTATPLRLDNKGFDFVFEKLITSWSINKFISEGYLAPFKHFITGIPDLKDVKKTQHTGDYDIEELARAMSQNNVMADLIESYLRYTPNTKTIVFAVNREHSEIICKRYKEAGFEASFIDYTTSKDERNRIINDFKANRIKILCNVSIFTEGFDCPDIETVQLARPTKSLALYYQQVGRALRPKADGKICTILDNANNWVEHGLINKDIGWTLQGKTNTENFKITTERLLNKGMSIDSGGIKMKEIAGVELLEVSEATVRTKREEYTYKRLQQGLQFLKKYDYEIKLSILQSASIKENKQAGILFNYSFLSTGDPNYENVMKVIYSKELLKRISKLVSSQFKKERIMSRIQFDKKIKKREPFYIKFDIVAYSEKSKYLTEIETKPFKVFLINSKEPVCNQSSIKNEVHNLLIESFSQSFESHKTKLPTIAD